MTFQVRTGPNVVLIPDAVDVICHDVEPVHIFFKAYNVKVFQIPETGRERQRQLPSRVV